MQRITHSTAVAELPPVTSSGEPGYFVEKNLSLGVPGTQITKDWLNGIQEEIATVIEEAGLELDGGDFGQLHQAIAQLISSAVTAVNGGIPSGTRCVFAQAAAPTGWTQVTDASLDNRMLRIVTGGGGGTGGTHSPILMDVVPAHSHGVSGVSVAAAGAHTHDYGANKAINYADTAGNYTAIIGIGAENWDQVEDTSAAGSHTHSLSGNVDANAGGANWQPRYFDLIVCQKV